MLNGTKKIRITENPYLLFLPFLLFYIGLVLISHVNVLTGDENRYFEFAQNLVHGFYSPPAPNVDFPNGPGYPIFLTPFVALHLPLLCMKLMNPILYYLSIVFLFKALKQFVSYKKTLLFCLFLGCYYIAFKYLHLILTETFTIFLISTLVLCLVNAFNTSVLAKKKKYIFLSGVIIGYIALTKVIFGYVSLFMLIGSGILWILNRNAANHRKGIIILLIAFATTVPYLIYTYNLTGRIFYWTTVGGNNLYWLSSPYKNEYGSWYSDVKTDLEKGFQKVDTPTAEYKSFFIPGGIDSMELHHKKDFEEINKYTGTKRDDVFKRLAIRNFKSHPVKYLENCVSNIGRMFFGYPISFFPQTPGHLLRLPPNGIIVVLMLFCIVPTLLNWRKLIYSLRFMLFFALFYFGGSVLGSADIRMFAIIVPIVLFWIAFIFQRSVKIKVKFD